MYEIEKNCPPNLLTEYVKEQDATYDNLPTHTKEQLKSVLLNEQGHLCAYCMGRIKLRNMRVEHWASQSHNPNLQLDYFNLLACCDGNEGSPKDSQVCDVRKENLQLKFSPARSEHTINSRIRYSANGVISSNDEEFSKQLEEVLNLNYHRLKENRKAALNVIHEKLNSRSGKRRKTQIQSLLNRVLEFDGDSKRLPFFGFMAFYLQSKL